MRIFKELKKMGLNFNDKTGGIHINKSFTMKKEKNNTIINFSDYEIILYDCKSFLNIINSVEKKTKIKLFG